MDGMDGTAECNAEGKSSKPAIGFTSQRTDKAKEIAFQNISLPAFYTIATTIVAALFSRFRYFFGHRTYTMSVVPTF